MTDAFSLVFDYEREHDIKPFAETSPAGFGEVRFSE